MDKKKNISLTPNAQSLRKNMTKEERHLWYDFFKKQSVTVNRQKVIGKYIVDFYCAEANLVVELDGSQHYNTQGHIADQERDAFLKQQGLSVLRYSNADVNARFEGVCLDILRHLFPSSTASGPPSPEGEGR